MDVKQKSHGSSSLFSINWWRDADTSHAFYLVYVQLAEKASTPADKGLVRLYKCSTEKRGGHSELVLTELTHRFDARSPDSVEDIYADAHAVTMNQQCHIALALLCRILTCDVNSIVTYDPDLPKQLGWKHVSLEHPACLLEWNRKTLRSCDYICVRHPLLCELTFGVKDYIRAFIETDNKEGMGDIECAPMDETSNTSINLHLTEPPNSPSIENRPTSPVMFKPLPEKKRKADDEPEDKQPSPKKQKVDIIKQSSPVDVVVEEKSSEPQPKVEAEEKPTANEEEPKVEDEEEKCPADEIHFESVDDLKKWAKQFVAIGLEQDGWVPKKKGKPVSGNAGELLKFDGSNWTTWTRLCTLFSFLQKTKSKSKVDIMEEIYIPAKGLLPEGEELPLGLFILAGIYFGFASQRPRWKDASAIKFGVRRDSIKGALKNMGKTVKGHPF